MQLKILVVPFFLIMILILCIGYIKPDFDEIMARRTTIVTQNDSIANVNSVINNIATLNSSLNKEKESEDFLLSYLPSTMNQDQSIDTFSYLASQSGLIISSMDLKKISKVTSIDIAPDGSVIENTNAFQPETFQFTGSVLGSYENIKTFFNHLARVNRFQNVQSFSVQKNDQTNVSENTTDLNGTFSVEYGYLPDKPVLSALNIPIFRSSEFNLSDVASLQTKITSVPILEKGQSGKPNPFQ